jgi:transcriptional regulator with XRE-family HTH domain
VTATERRLTVVPDPAPIVILARDSVVGPILRSLREDAGLSTRQVAALGHVSKSGVAKRETAIGGTIGALIDHAAALGYVVALMPADQAARRTSRDRITEATRCFIADYEHLRASGLSRNQIAERLGMERAAVDAAYIRAVRRGLLTPDRRTA